ncbi:MAG TPA: DUF2752 domain-containing protein [Pseudobacteroides sp.]|uniref:DUF2752 domain-containing protein n=1 Tax=Pseudobacteroides sp. TaxID=1968840 RepID=UPI002F924764
MSKLQNTLNKVLPLLIALLFVAILLLLDGSACLFKNVWGIPCPGCGMTRAFLAVLKLDILTGFYYHPLFVLPVLIAVLYMVRNKRIGKVIFGNNMVWLLSLIVTLSVWAIRMILFFPDTSPMDINKNAVLFKVLRFIFNSWP